MPEHSSGLPPVGELVQITDRYDGVAPAFWDGHSFNASDRTHGVRLIGPGRVTSWCRVLVLPDTEETQDRIEAALNDLDVEAWRRNRERNRHIVGVQGVIYQAGRVLAALREAAIR